MVARLLFTASLILTNSAGATSKLVFTGDLERVTDQTISIRLDDGRIIEARNTATRGEMSPQSLAERHKVGDRVEMTCEHTNGILYQPVGRRLFLEVKKLQFLPEPGPEQRALALKSRAWNQGPNLLHADSPTPEPASSPTDGQSPEWTAHFDQIRTRILQFVAKLPNFVADEVAERYVSTVAAPDWRPVDVIQSEITFKGNSVSRDHILVNGAPWSGGYRALPGFKWTDAFGSQLAYLFDERCPTTFAPEGTVSEGGTTLSVIRYNSPPDGCEFYWQDYQQFYPGRTGRILLDEHEENVIRLDTTCGNFPEDFPMASSEKQVFWDYVKIGEETHLLPVSAIIRIKLANGEMRLARHVYKNHRHFEAASNITYH